MNGVNLAVSCSLLLAALAAPLSGQASTERSLQERIAAFENGLRGQSGTPDAEARWQLEARMAHYGVPGVSIAVLRSGRIAWAKGYGVKQNGKNDPIDTETVFSVGSVSKVGAAAATLRLVAAGKLDLDRDVNEFLKTWKVPSNRYTVRAPVTLRRILSHTAGLTVHGFRDFEPGESTPTTIQILEGSGPAKNSPVLVDTTPGTRFRYSGGGITLEQLIVEEATNLGFSEAARKLVFEPLGMKRSSYENPLPEAHGNIAKAHDGAGSPRALPRGYEAMPETAASGLWTSPSDLARLIIALIRSHQGVEDPFLDQAVAIDMMTAVAPSEFGLGPQLDRGPGTEANRRFSHGGSNNSYKAWMEGHLDTGNGLVVLTNGARGRELIREIRRAIPEAEGWE